MADWSTPIANEFIRLAKADRKLLTQMQLQKLVYIAHGWNLAINGQPLTHDDPQAWEHGPVYRQLWQALRDYGREPVKREVKNGEYDLGGFADDLDAVARPSLTDAEGAVIGRVYSDYGRFHAFQLSALTHRPGTPWSRVYANGNGKFSDIKPELIREHFVDLARQRHPAAHS